MSGIRRREFLLLGGGAAAWPLAARAQQQPKVYRIGALFVGNADVESLRTELREALRKAGYVEGQNLLFEVRSAEEELDRLPRLAAELVALKVDVIVAIYTPCALAAQWATREIPIGHLEKFLSPSRCESDSVTVRGHGRMERAGHGAEGLFRC